MTMQLDEQKTDAYEEVEIELSEPEAMDEPEEGSDLLTAFLENGIVKGENMFSPYVIKNLDKFDERNCLFCKEDFLQLKGRKTASYCCNAHRKAQFVKKTKAENEANVGSVESKATVKTKKATATSVSNNATGPEAEANSIVTSLLLATGNDTSEAELVKPKENGNESSLVTKVEGDNRYQASLPSNDVQINLPEYANEKTLPTSDDLETPSISSHLDSQPLEETLPTLSTTGKAKEGIPAMNESGNDAFNTLAIPENETALLLLDSIVTSLTTVTKEACNKADQVLTEMEKILSELLNGAGNETTAASAQAGNVTSKERVAELNSLSIRAGEKVWLLEKHSSILVSYLESTGLEQAKVKPSATQTNVVTTLVQTKAVKDKFNRVVTLLRGNVPKR